MELFLLFVLFVLCSSQNCYIKGESFVKIQEINNNTHLEVSGCGICGWTAIAFSTTPSTENISFGIAYFDLYVPYAHPFYSHYGINLLQSEELLIHSKSLNYESRNVLFDKSAFYLVINRTLNWEYLILTCRKPEFTCYLDEKYEEYPLWNRTSKKYNFLRHNRLDLIPKTQSIILLIKKENLCYVTQMEPENLNLSRYLTFLWLIEIFLLILITGLTLFFRNDQPLASRGIFPFIFLSVEYLIKVSSVIFSFEDYFAIFYKYGCFVESILVIPSKLLICFLLILVSFNN
jgi:hypothetical protein